MAFEKPTGNPNCEATERGCNFCVRIGELAVDNAIKEARPDVAKQERDLYVGRSKVRAIIDGSGEASALQSCYARQDRADTIGYDIGKMLAERISDR